MNLTLVYSKFTLGMDKSAEQRVYEFDDFRLDAGHLMLYRDGAEISLVPKAVRTLLVLVERRGEIISKEELIGAVWPDTVVEESNLFSYLTQLRKTLGDQKNGHPYIETLRRRGYRFNGDVRLTCRETAPLPSENFVATPGDSITHEKNTKAPKLRYVLVISVGAIFAAALFTASFYWRSGLAKRTDPGEPKAVAVLPFKPLVAENHDEVLELGMADTLITLLGNNRKMLVRPLSSVRDLGNLDQDPVTAGKALNVDYVLEGSLQRYGDRISANVRLIKVADGTGVWADTFNEPYTNIFNVQKTIATQIADALNFHLTGDEIAQLEKRSTNSTEAYDYYLRGRYNVFKITQENMRQGIAFYEKAVTADPNYALAYAGMADAYRRLASAGFARPKEVCPKAREFATKALELDGSLAEAYIALGWIDFMYDWDWDAAEAKLKRAIDLSPNNPDAHFAYAHFLSDAGRHDEAVNEIRRARMLGQTTLITYAVESMILNAAGREDEAILPAKKTLDFDRNFWPARLQLGIAYYRQKRYGDAITELEKANELAPQAYQAMSSLGLVYAAMGDKKRAYAILNEMEHPTNGRYFPFHKLAIIYNALGQKEKALNLVERALEEHETHLVDIRSEKSWDNQRSEPRYRELLKKMNLEK